MELTGCEEQVVAWATTLKGDPTAAALAGELTVMPELAAGVEEDSCEELDPEEDPDAEVDEPDAEVDEPAAGADEPGAEVDEPGAVAAWVALVAAPPQPATAASTTSKERERRRFFKVTSDPSVEVSVAEAGPIRSCLRAATSAGGNCFCLVRIYECSG